MNGVAVAIVLDAWALVAFLKDEPAAARIEEAWLQSEAVMCSVNLGEVLYTEIRAHGEGVARATIDRVRNELTVIDPGWQTVSDAAVLKAQGGVSYADCFAVATARHRGAPLWTGDPEIIALCDAQEIVDLR